MNQELNGAAKRVVSGMRATGKLHLGHYHGVIKNWLTLQHEYDCFFFIADWHALTTHYADPSQITRNASELAIDWLACGLNPGEATIYIQSQVPEHAQLHLLLSMVTPLGWLERVPTYKEQQEKLGDKDLSTYGFLGYPLLQSADVLIYQADFVPVGEDQVPHIELTREIARRFNHLYGRDGDFAVKAEQAIAKMGKKNAKLYRRLLKAYQEQGEHEALATGRALVAEQQNLSINDRERLFGYIEGGGKVILTEPQALLTPNAKFPGLDGQKMSKSYGNFINLRDDVSVVDDKIRTMQTDPARVRRTDAGEPEKCPVWDLHKIYSNDDTKEWVQQGCRSAGIGCLDCKKSLLKEVHAELEPIRERAVPYENNRGLVKSILAEGAEEARKVARETLDEVNDVMGLDYT